jgi:radical SAM protein with 4Fe4S-binding SPASM domain
MPDEILFGLMEQLRRAEFTGTIHPNLYGEPMLDQRIYVICELAGAMGARVKMFSNGDYLDLPTIDKLQAAGMSEIVVTDHNPVPNPRWFSISHGILTVRRFDGAVLHNRGGSIETEQTAKPAEKCFPADGKATYVNYLGDVVLCCDDWSGKTFFGNVGKESIDKIWRKPEYFKARKGLRKNRYYYEICKKCNFNADKKIELRTDIPEWTKR